MTTSSSKPTTDLERFYDQYLKDPTLQEQLKTATTPENMCELAVELGKEQGYRFTKEEAMAALESGGIRGSGDPSHIESHIILYAK